jgi:hypothetical protein
MHRLTCHAHGFQTLADQWHRRQSGFLALQDRLILAGKIQWANTGGAGADDHIGTCGFLR